MINKNENICGQLMVEKLKKLNNSQNGIETLSRWCILHRKNAKQVVETWEKRFHCSQRDQRVPFLFLANDILQNSRWKGLEFVEEFWKVLPNALKDVIENGDKFGEKAALRLVDILEKRKVFGSRGQALKEEFLGKRNKSGKNIAYKLKLPNGEMREKLISSFERVNGLIDEDVLFGKCRTAISFIEKLENNCGTKFNIGNIGGPVVLPELQLQHGLLKEYIQQLQLAESSRSTLLSHLREALHEQESKMEQLHNQLEAAQLWYDRVELVLAGKTVVPLSVQELNEVPPPPPLSDLPEIPPPPDYPPDSPSEIVTDMELSTPIHYPQQCTVPYYMPQLNQPPPPFRYSDSLHPLPPPPPPLPPSVSPITPLAPSATAPQFGQKAGSLTCVPYTFESRLLPPLPPSVSLFTPLAPSATDPQFGQKAGSLTYVPYTFGSRQLPPLPPSFSPIPPLASSTAAPQFGQTSGSLTCVPYTYGSPLPPSSQFPPYPMVGVPPYPGPPNPCHVQGSDNGGVFAHQPMMAAPPPMSRQQEWFG